MWPFQTNWSILANDDPALKACGLQYRTARFMRRHHDKVKSRAFLPRLGCITTAIRRVHNKVQERLGVCIFAFLSFAFHRQVSRSVLESRELGFT